ncbi:MAG: molybdate ABC transporter permease subunit [Clostridiales bacterium]|nr:molybdate ABC transporter permease subunit [Clostridiales bacterium]
MDWFPLFNSLRIALIATACTFFLGILAAYYIARLPPLLKGVLDCVFTMPLVLPPTVVGFFLLKLLGPKAPVGAWVSAHLGARITMTWYAAVFAVVIVTFPLMYRTVRGAFEAFDETLIHAGRTLGRSNTWVFWRVLMPGCKQGILAGAVLAFARGLGEYGATSMVSGYTPGRSATISTTVYQLWREGNDALAYRWVAVNLLISFGVLVAINLLERRRGGAVGRPAAPAGGV